MGQFLGISSFLNVFFENFQIFHKTALEFSPSVQAGSHGRHLDQELHLSALPGDFSPNDDLSLDFIGAMSALCCHDCCHE